MAFLFLGFTGVETARKHVGEMYPYKLVICLFLFKNNHYDWGLDVNLECGDLKKWDLKFEISKMGSQHPL